MTAAEHHPALPAGLRDRVLAATLRARAVGRPEPAAPEISPAQAFSQAADACYGMLGVLRAADWRKPALRELDVQGLVGHHGRGGRRPPGSARGPGRGPGQPHRIDSARGGPPGRALPGPDPRRVAARG